MPDDTMDSQAATSRDLDKSDTTPMVSLGLPVYNGARFLRECIDSIIAQTYKDFELIVCDNKSDDETVAIVEEYIGLDPRISLHRATENRGAAANFNWTFHLARGQFFKWCAADDVLRPEYVRRCVQALESHPSAVMAYSGAVDIDEDSVVLREIYDNRSQLQFDAPDAHTRFRHLACIDHSCIAAFGVARRSKMLKTSLIGPYVGSDRAFLVELGLQGPIVRVADDLLLHREHAGRSVNEIQDLRRRARWFDTRAKGHTFPHWRILGEYSRAALSSELSTREKLRCLYALARWIKWGHWRKLLADLTAAPR